MSEICSSANHKKSSKTSGSEDRMQMIESIFEEYSLKKNKFNPDKTSPNQFLNKLELRMKQYYISISKDTDCSDVIKNSE
tara:strand:- start:43 stop:282 length:240 start_codon:yes stop_codon:yes gene_type:complete